MKHKSLLKNVKFCSACPCILQKANSWISVSFDDFGSAEHDEVPSSCSRKRRRETEGKTKPSTVTEPSQSQRQKISPANVTDLWVDKYTPKAKVEQSLYVIQ